MVAQVAPVTELISSPLEVYDRVRQLQAELKLAKRLLRLSADVAFAYSGSLDSPLAPQQPAQKRPQAASA